MTFKEFKKLTPEERRTQALDSISDSVKDMAHQLAFLKAMAKDGQDIAPEDFDKVWSKEYSKEWDKFKNKTAEELAMISLVELMMGGANLKELLEE